MNKSLVTILVLMVLFLSQPLLLTWERGHFSVEEEATVIRVIDGDTLVIKVDGQEENVRLLRVDAPETPDECYSGAAHRKLQDLTPPGSEVRLELDVEQRDMYGRLLAHVWRDGTWVNQTLLREGYGTLMTIPPNVKHTALLEEAERQAFIERKGIWNAQTYPPEGHTYCSYPAGVDHGDLGAAQHHELGE